MDKFFTRAMGLLLFLVVIWGVSWSIYKVALEFTPPILFAGIRSLLGGLMLGLVLLPSWKRIRWRENWRAYCVSALLNAVFFYGLQTMGLEYLPGGLFSVLIYFQPVLIGIFAWLWLGESMTALKITGLLAGFFGIAVISADSFGGALSVPGIILALLAAVSWALGVVFVKKVSDTVDSMWMVSLQFIVGGVILTAVGTVVESWTDIIWNTSYFIGLGFGSTLGIPVAFVIYFHLINRGEASKVAAFTFLVPLIAVLTGTFFLQEPVTYTLVIGLVLIVSSIYLVNRQPKKSKI
ncbi:DMT family transporter [Planomicrobium sp. CPCC 101079]|uniref:DMT family transporter n=1 Tax=Planomicrobium sp. CPCC 101079 TaxID=2599618 RepID=UPI0011B701DF|nr:DMT family transporter [Planomicrobium sp. CPCC 101079]TWT02473.1 DMT family transporter [Planomicrobium sp. CPCC 101079]